MTLALIIAAMLSQPPADPPAKPEQPAAQPSQPSLDDLLGIPKDSKPGAKPRPPAPDPNAKVLEEKLSAAEAADQLKQAVALMGQTAERLQTSKDTGLATQRIQEDILRKLDQVIKAAEQNQQQSRSQRSQGQRDKQQQQPDQQQTPQRNPGPTEPASDVIDPPAQQKAEPTPGVAARGAAWGALPERLRDALTQGNTDKYSAIWQNWTEAYYKRLAEDAHK